MVCPRVSHQDNMIKIQPFGPTIGKWKLSDDVFHKLLQITDELIDNKDTPVCLHPFTCLLYTSDAADE